MSRTITGPDTNEARERMTMSTQTEKAPSLLLEEAAHHLSTDEARYRGAFEPRPARLLVGATDVQDPVWWEPATDGPLQIIGGTGAGGTVFLRSLALQALRSGAVRVDVVDIKMGHGWNDLDRSQAHERGLMLHLPDRAGLAQTLEAVSDAAQDVRVREEAGVGRRGRGVSARRFVFVDALELFARAVKDQDPDAHERLLCDLAELHLKGDRVGVHLVTHTHRPHRLLPHPDKRTWRQVLALARLSPASTRDLPDRSTAFRDIPSKERGRWLIAGGLHRTVVRVPAALPGWDTSAVAGI